mgnify:FL=1
MNDNIFNMIKNNQNNLKHLIRLAGLTHAEVAEKKGIAPESLSRHISGKSQFSIQDARDYAEILDIDPSQLLFPPPQMHIYGTIIDANKVEMVNASDPIEYWSVPVRYPPFVGLFKDKREEYNTFLDGAITTVDIRPIQSQSIPQTTFGKWCIVKTEDGQILQRTIYPNHNGKFTLSSVGGRELLHDVKLKFACPVLTRVERPELLGFKIIS